MESDWLHKEDTVGRADAGMWVNIFDVMGF